MTDKDKTSSIEDEMKAIEIENASYIDVEPQKTSPTPKKSLRDEKPNTSQKTAKTGLLWFVSLVNLLLLAVVIAGAYWGWIEWNKSQSEQDEYFANQETTLSTQLSNIRAQNESNDSLRNDFNGQTEALTTAIDEIESRLVQTQQEVLANEKKLADVSGRRPSDWLLAEADYLVRMAGRKLWLEHDVKTAVLMLQSADSRLQDLADPSLLPIRQSIANDIQTLQQINQVSLTSIALALSGMIKQVDNLPLSLPEVEVQGPEKEDLTGFERFFRELTDNFKYQSNDKPLKPMLDQQQQWLAREQLKYSLLLAQSAVLKEQGTLLQQSVQQSISLLVDHYDLEQPSVTQFIDGLQNIEKTKIERSYPSELQSAQPLKDIMETRLDGAFSNRKFEL